LPGSAVRFRSRFASSVGRGTSTRRASIRKTLRAASMPLAQCSRPWRKSQLAFVVRVYRHAG